MSFDFKIESTREVIKLSDIQTTCGIAKVKVGVIANNKMERIVGLNI